MIVEEADRTDLTEWDAFVARHPGGSPYHTSRWQTLTSRCFGHPQSMLVARDAGGAVAGVLPLVRLRSPMFGHFCISLPYVNFGGALGASEEAEHALMREASARARAAGAAHVEYRDEKPRGCEWPVRTDKVEMELALPDDPDAFMKGVGAKLRAQIKRPMKEGATVHHGGAELVPEFYRVFTENMRDLGTPVYPRRFFEEIMETFPDQAEIAVVRVGPIPAAAGLTLRFRGRTEIPWASSLRRFNRIGVNMLLYAEVIKRAIERGQQVFDFGRSTKDAGTYRFKRQWGAEPRQLYWHYALGGETELPALNPDNPKFALAIRLWQQLPLPVANLLGPRIVKYLP